MDVGTFKTVAEALGIGLLVGSASVALVASSLALATPLARLVVGAGSAVLARGLAACASRGWLPPSAAGLE